MARPPRKTEAAAEEPVAQPEIKIDPAIRRRYDSMLLEGVGDLLSILADGEDAHSLGEAYTKVLEPVKPTWTEAIVRRSLELLNGIARFPIQTPLEFCYEAPGGPRLFEEALGEDYYPLAAEKEIIEECPLQTKGRIVIEFGAGDGLKTAKVFQKHGFPEYYINVDVSELHLDVARTNLIDAGLDPNKIISIKGDFLDPNLDQQIEAAIAQIENHENLSRTGMMLGATLGNFIETDLTQKLFVNFRKVLRGQSDDVGYISADSTTNDEVILKAYSSKGFAEWMKNGVMFSFHVAGLIDLRSNKIKYEPRVVDRPNCKVLEMQLRNLAQQPLRFDSFYRPIFGDRVALTIMKNEIISQGRAIKWSKEFLGKAFQSVGLDVATRFTVDPAKRPQHDHAIYELKPVAVPV